MGVFLRTSRNTGVSMPWWLAIPVAMIWLVVMLAVLIYGLTALAMLWLYRHGAAAWRRRHPA